MLWSFSRSSDSVTPLVHYTGSLLAACTCSIHDVDMNAPLHMSFLRAHISRHTSQQVEAGVLANRPDVNQAFYGSRVDARDVLSGNVKPPAAAKVLYEALNEVASIPDAIPVWAVAPPSLAGEDPQGLPTQGQQQARHQGGGDGRFESESRERRQRAAAAETWEGRDQQVGQQAFESEIDAFG